jgi:hypothetical protein
MFYGKEGNEIEMSKRKYKYMQGTVFLIGKSKTSW